MWTVLAFCRPGVGRPGERSAPRRLQAVIGGLTSRPEASVIVTDVRSFEVAVFGEAMRPGRYGLKSWASLLDVLRLCERRLQAPR